MPKQADPITGLQKEVPLQVRHRQPKIIIQVTETVQEILIAMDPPVHLEAVNLLLETQLRLPQHLVRVESDQ